MLAEWLDHRTTTKKPTTVAKDRMYVSVFAAFVSERHGAAAPVTLLSPELLDAYVAHLAQPRPVFRDGKLAKVVEAGARTRRKHANAILTAWRWARGRAARYPGIPEAPHRYETIRPVDRPAAAPTWEQADQLVAHLAGVLERTRAHHAERWGSKLRAKWVALAETTYRAFYVQRFTGLRITQALRVEWDDLDFEARLLTVRPELGKTAQEEQGRTIPVSEHLLAELATWGRREGHVCGARGVAAYTSIRKRLIDGWVACGIPERVWKGSPTHCLRDLVSTELKAAGCDWHAVEYYVGHSLGVAGRYTDPRAHELVAIAEAFPAVGAGAVNLDAARAKRAARADHDGDGQVVPLRPARDLGSRVRELADAIDAGDLARARVLVAALADVITDRTAEG